MKVEQMMFLGKTAYVFLDEGGNFDFSDKGTSWFSLTSITKYRPFICYNSLISKRYDLIESGIELEYFHASHDRQTTRNEVFGSIKKCISEMRVDSILVNKRKTDPQLYSVEKFYPIVLYYLLYNVFNGMIEEGADNIIVFTDTIPIQRKRRSVSKAIKESLAEMLPRIPYRMFHHESKSNVGLQIADYCNWAIYKKWESDRGELRPYRVVQKAIRSEHDIFANRETEYY